MEPRHNDEEDGDTVLDDRLSDYDGDEDRPNLTSGEAAAIREAEKNRKRIQMLLFIMTFFTSLIISTIKWYSRPNASYYYGYDGTWDIFGGGYLDKRNQLRLNRTIEYLLAANISGNNDWLPVEDGASGTLIDLYDDSYSPQYKASLWLSTLDRRRLDIPDAGSTQTSLDEYFFLQRYVLAVLFFATGGLKNWAYSLRFLTGSHECYWYEIFGMDGLPPDMGIAFGVKCDKDPQVNEKDTMQRDRIVTQIIMLRELK